MIKQNATADKHIITLSVMNTTPMSSCFGDGVRTDGMQYTVFGNG